MKIKYIITAILLWIVSINPQSSDNSNVAIIGSKIISSEQFLERYEFTPGFSNNNNRFSELSKSKFFYTLIAEKLWAVESIELGLDKTEVIVFAKQEFEKMFIRDELYHREILDKISFSDEELEEARRRNTTTLKVNFLFSEDEDEIYHLYNLINERIEFDSILAESPEVEEQFYPVEIVYGQMADHVEDSLYNLKLWENTAPIFTPDGWYIFRLVNRSEQLFTSLSENDEINKSAEKILRARKEKVLYWNFKRSFFSDKKVEIDPDLFESLVRNISKIFKNKNETTHTKEEGLIHLLAEDVIELENMFGDDSLSLNFILFDEEPLTLKQFIRIFAFEGFKSEDIELVALRKIIDNKTRTIIENELLAREGYKRGLQYLPEIQNQVNVWLDNYLFQVLQNKFLDSVLVTEEEVYQYYIQRQKEESYPVLINLLKVFSNDAETLEKIAEQIKDEKDIKEIVGRAAFDNSNLSFSETGLIPISSSEDLIMITDSVKTGDLFGPVILNDNYMIAIVMDRQEEKVIPPVPFEKVKEQYKLDLAKKKAKAIMTNYTTSLAIKHGFEINVDLLNSIEVTNITSFGIRHLGFGGKITAVPMLSPNVDWVEPYYKKLKIIQ